MGLFGKFQFYPVCGAFWNLPNYQVIARRPLSVFQSVQLIPRKVKNEGWFSYSPGLSKSETPNVSLGRSTWTPSKESIRKSQHGGDHILRLKNV